MATYKGTGLDTTNGAMRTGSSSDDVAFAMTVSADDGLDVTGNATVTLDLTVSNDVIVTKDIRCGGDLTVTGSITAIGGESIVYTDNIIDLGLGNSTATAKAGGWTANMSRDSTFTAETAITFDKAIVDTSNAKITFNSASSFAIGDVMCVTGSTVDGSTNDGFYQVLSVAGAVVKIAGIGGDGSASGDMPFVQTDVVSVTGATATCFQCDISVALFADGINFDDAAGSPYAEGTFLTTFKASATKALFEAHGAYSKAEGDLQTAYDGGNSITTKVGSTTPIKFVLSEDAAGFIVDGDGASEGNVLFGGATTINQFTVDTGANIALTAGSTAALTGGTTATMTSASGSAATIADGVGTLVMTSGSLTETSLVNCNLSGTGTMTLTGGGLSKFGDDTGTIDFSGAGLITDTDVVSYDLTPSGIFTANAGGAATLQGGTTATVQSASGSNLQLKDGVVTAQWVSGAYSDSGAVSYTHAPSGLYSVVAGAAATFKSGGSAALTLGDGVAAITSTAGAVNSTGITTLGWNATDTTNMTMSANAASKKEMTISATNAHATNDGNLILKGDQISMIGSIVGAYVPYVPKASASLAKGDLVYIAATTGKVALADSDAILTTRFAGILHNSPSGDGQNAEVNAYGVATITTVNDVAAAKIGQPIYLAGGGDAGKGTMTKPTAANSVVYEIGLITNATGASTVDVLIRPQLVYINE